MPSYNEVSILAKSPMSGVGERNSGGDIPSMSWSGLRRKDIEVAEDELVIGILEDDPGFDGFVGGVEARGGAAGGSEGTAGG
jgi:hypothetical protein